MEKLIYRVAMRKSKKYLIEVYSKEWYMQFEEISSIELKRILPKIPPIGKSIFSFNYKFGPVYIAWYLALVKLQIPQNEIDQIIWKMNERMIGIIPKRLLQMVGKSYLTSFQKKSKQHVERQNTTGVSEYDWKINYKDIDSNCFEIDIRTCGLQRLAKDFGAEGLFPGICRMDYLYASLMGNGFERTKTLGDGDECCNCRYYMTGSCEWAPEKGFIDRR